MYKGEHLEIPQTEGQQKAALVPSKGDYQEFTQRVAQSLLREDSATKFLLSQNGTDLTIAQSPPRQDVQEMPKGFTDAGWQSVLKDARAGGPWSDESVTALRDWFDKQPCQTPIELSNSVWSLTDKITDAAQPTIDMHMGLDIRLNPNGNDQHDFYISIGPGLRGDRSNTYIGTGPKACVG